MTGTDIDWKTEQRLAHAAMLATQRPVERYIASDFSFGDYDWMVDVGGGAGGLATAVKTRWPRLRVTVADIDPDVAEADESACGAGVEFQVADFFEVLPAGADLYTAKLVLHDWEDPDAERILQTIGCAMGSTGTALLIESALPLLGSPTVACLWDYHQMVTMGGRERTLAEFEELAGRAGLAVVDFCPTAPPFHFITLRSADEAAD